MNGLNPPRLHSCTSVIQRRTKKVICASSPVSDTLSVFQTDILVRLFIKEILGHANYGSFLEEITNREIGLKNRSVYRYEVWNNIRLSIFLGELCLAVM